MVFTIEQWMQFKEKDEQEVKNKREHIKKVRHTFSTKQSVIYHPF